MSPSHRTWPLTLENPRPLWLILAGGESRVEVATRLPGPGVEKRNSKANNPLGCSRLSQEEDPKGRKQILIPRSSFSLGQPSRPLSCPPLQ